MSVYVYVGPSMSRNSTEHLRPKNSDSFCSRECCLSIKGNVLQCNCGENWRNYEWTWENNSEANNAVLSNDNRQVLFHPVYSSGTAIVKGKEPFKQNFHYYWEIKILSNLYGTDVMIGVGTSKVVLTDWKFRFCSMLGYDAESWGYSYHGTIQHKRCSRKYGSQFGVGSIIGLHLDMCSGTLEYYLNRKPLGIAFKGLKSVELYPMVSSTAAQSSIRMSCAVSEVPTLQLSCLRVINKHPSVLKQYRSITALTRWVEKKYFWLVPHVVEKETQKNKLELEDEAVLPTNRSYNSRQSKRLRTIRWVPSSLRADPDHMIYRSSDTHMPFNREIDQLGGNSSNSRRLSIETLDVLDENSNSTVMNLSDTESNQSEDFIHDAVVEI